MGRILVGAWRDDAKGPMQVVSGAMGRERVHFEAPAAKRLPKDMRAFLKWFDEDNEPNWIIKAGLAHLWFVTIHPFDDGNGRIGRAILDMGLARADERPWRCYSVSAQIRKERAGYYAALERSQRSSLDATDWLLWYVNCLGQALDAALETIAGALARSRFWQRHSDKALNERQRKVLSRMLMGLEGKMTSSKWATMAKCSAPTAVRDLNELIEMRIIARDEAGGRSAAYHLASD